MQPRRHRSFDLGVLMGYVLAREVKRSLGRVPVLLRVGLLAWFNRGKGVDGIGVFCPDLRGIHDEYLSDLGMQPDQVPQRLRDTLIGRECSSAFGVLAPSVRTNEHARLRAASVDRVED
jgi:hypothetical protein